MQRTQFAVVKLKLQNQDHLNCLQRKHCRYSFHLIELIFFTESYLIY